MSDIVFSGPYIDRQCALRTAPAELEAARSGQSARFVVIWRNRCLVRSERIALLRHNQVLAVARQPDNSALLGRLGDRHVFTLVIDPDEAPDFGANMEFVGLREIGSRLTAEDAALAAYARAIVAWQDTHRYCGICGARNIVTDGGFVMACTDATCGHRSFPRLDPAVIVLVHRGERALLGRQANWPEGRFSTVAGFVEPGESLEDAIRREVAEETNIEVGDVTYVASQPWPFPAALMIGFHAEGRSADIRLNDGELADARWISRDEIAAGEIVLPPRISVAYRLVETWFDRHDGPTLAELNLPAPPFRTPRPMDDGG